MHIGGHRDGISSRHPSTAPYVKSFIKSEADS